MNNRSGGKPRLFELTTYLGDGAEPEKRLVTASELMRVDLRPFAHIMWHPRKMYAFRDTRGKLMRRPIRGSGLGVVCQLVIEVIQDHPGVMLTSEEIADLTVNPNLASDNALGCRVVWIRRAHLETVKDPRFFPSGTGPFALMWPVEYAWMRVKWAGPQP